MEIDAIRKMLAGDEWGPDFGNYDSMIEAIKTLLDKLELARECLCHDPFCVLGHRDVIDANGLLPTGDSHD